MSAPPVNTGTSSVPPGHSLSPTVFLLCRILLVVQCLASLAIPVPVGEVVGHKLCASRRLGRGDIGPLSSVPLSNIGLDITVVVRMGCMDSRSKGIMDIIVSS